MDDSREVLTGEFVEVLVRSGHSEKQNVVEEVGKDNTSFDMFIRTVLALEEDPRREHSYAFSDKKIAFEGKEKDHCYSTNSKLTPRKVQSLSEENLQSSSLLQPVFPSHCTPVLPHYQSKDSALDVTGFDTISQKCLSYDNIELKTVDVFTERCILPGTSDPDISKMTIQGRYEHEGMGSGKSASLPSSLSTRGQRLILDHTYSSSSKKSESDAVSSDHDKSPLFDHSYDSNQKRRSLPNNVGIKRGRSSEMVNFLSSQVTVKSTDFTKSPFLDHTYQSVELKCFGKRQIMERGPYSSENISDRNKTGMFPFPTQLSQDHTYGQNINQDEPMLATRVRSNSVSSKYPLSFSDLVPDHSYVQTQLEDLHFEEVQAQGNELSDSGTESLDEEEIKLDVPRGLMTFHKDHSYVTKKMAVQ